MKSIEELNSEISRLLEKHAFEAVNTILSENTAKTGLIKPLEPEINFWNNVGFYYLRHHMFQQAGDLYKALYETQLREQGEGERLHKGMALHNWGVSNLNLQRRPEAQELITMAYIEDCITSGKNAVEKLGYKTLRNEFNLPDELLNAIYLCATSTHVFDKYPPVDPKKVLEIFRRDNETWVRRARDNALINLNLDYYNDLLQKARIAKTNDEKKKTLETLSEVLFSSIKGFTVLPSVRTSKAEIDRIIRNYSDHPLLRDLGLHVLIECKNWSEPVGASIIRDFNAKVEDHRCTSGILLSQKGITGEGTKAAKGEIRDAYKVKGMTIIVLTEQDLEAIGNGKNPIIILEMKYEEVKFM